MSTNVTAKEPKRPSWIMDPDHPVRPVNDRSLRIVQEWIWSSLIVVTVVHLAAGIVVAAVLMDSKYSAQRIGLSVIATLMMLVGLMAARAIHKARILSWWLLCAPIPSAVGIYFICR